MTLFDKGRAWIELTRFDKPVGIELLLYPTLWGLFLASAAADGLPSVQFLVIFIAGTVLMRAAGCAINDFADRHVDGAVERTRRRPLADGRLAPKTALLSFVGLGLLAMGLLIFLPVVVLPWAAAAAGLAFIYPFMKRYTHLPQVVLGAAFGMGIFMAYVATLGTATGTSFALFVAYLCQTVAYDTQYALCDRDDDRQVGIKSTAILFGAYDLAMIIVLQAVFVLLMVGVLWQMFAWAGIAVLLPVLPLFVWQFVKMRVRTRQAYFAAFANNVWVGRYVFLAIALLCVWRYGAVPVL